MKGKREMRSNLICYFLDEYQNIIKTTSRKTEALKVTTSSYSQHAKYEATNSKDQKPVSTNFLGGADSWADLGINFLAAVFPRGFGVSWIHVMERQSNTL